MSLALRAINPDRLTTLALPEVLDVAAVDTFLQQLDGMHFDRLKRVYLDFRSTRRIDRCGLNLLKMARRQLGPRCELQAINLNNQARQCLYKLAASRVIDWR